jgi:hypothetical protein
MINLLDLVSLKNDLPPGFGIEEILTLMGFCLAIFTILIPYLSFPKNLLENLERCSGTKEDRNRRNIIKFFYVMDLVIALFMVYLTYTLFFLICVLGNMLRIICLQ